MRVAEVARKNVVTCRPDESIPMVAKMMLDNWIGSVIVVNNKQEPVGFVTDGIIFNLIAKGKNPTILLARDVMVKPVQTVHMNTNVLDISDDEFLKSKVNRLAVVDDEGKLTGIISRKVVDQVTKYSIARRIVEERS
jgi:CBS domain-containing protein